MLINEITKNSNQPLNEGMMKYPEWKKEKYSTPFLDAITTGEEQAITFIKHGEELHGIVQNTEENKENAATLKQWIADNAPTKNYASMYFTVDVLDDDEKPTGKIEYVKLQEIVKDEKITGTLNVNLGNIAELVLGCAVTAKYELQKAEVTSEDVISVAIRLAKSNGTVVSKAGKDKISFSASVPSADKKAFAAFVGEDPKGRSTADLGIKPAVIKGINQHITSAVRYVNESPRVLLAVDKAAADPGKNNVDVVSDGGNAEQQKTTKVDLKISIDGTQINLLSIKAGNVGQFGQVSGYEFEKMNSFFEQSVGLNLSDRTKKKFMELDTTLKGKERVANKVEARDINFHNGFTAAYDEVEKLLKGLARGDQVDLLERVYTGLLHHATRNEAGVEMVILSPTAKKAFSELTFGPELREALNDYNLVINRGSSEKMHLLQVYGIPKTAKVKQAMGGSKEMLVQYRSYQQANAVRNIIEMGNLLKELADWEKIESRKTTKQNDILDQWGFPHKIKKQKKLPATTAATAPTTTKPVAPTPTTPAPAGATEPTTPALANDPNELDQWRKNAGMDVRFSGE